MPRGGRRAGAEGRSYQNRTDLNQQRGPLPIAAATGQQYGKASEQMAAQRALPMGPPPSPSVGPVAPSPATGPTPPSSPMIGPGGVVPLDAPSQRPDEPITAGMDVGAGPGSEVLGALGGGGEDVGMQLRAIYARFPNEDIRTLIELLDDDED